MPKSASQLDREIAEALRKRSGGSRTLVEQIAAWITKTRGTETGPLLRDVVTDAAQSYSTRPTRDKLLNKASAILVDVLLHRYAKGPEFFTWLEDVMERVGSKAARSGLEQLGLNATYLDSEDPFTVSARYVGGSQDPDTEVPSHLSHNDIVRALAELGGKASCDWQIREFDAGWGRTLHTVYECRATFSMKELPARVFGNPALEAAVDHAIAAWEP